MTPLERATEISRRAYDSAREYAPICPALVDWIHSAIVEATNAEVERRRAAEARCERLQSILDSTGTKFEVHATDYALRLRIRHPHTGEWWGISAVKEGEVGHGR